MKLTCRGRLAAIMVLSALICGALAAGAAAASSRDIAATDAFVHSSQLMLQRSIAAVPRMARRATRFVNHVAADCPGALSAMPAHPSAVQRRVGQAVMTEIIVDFSLAAGRPLEGIARRDASRISALRWSRPAVNQAVAAYARGERLGLHLSSNPCPDVKAVEADGFSQMPPRARRLLTAVRHTVNAPSLGALLRLMRPSITAAERSQIKGLRRLEIQLQRELNAALSPSALRLIDVLMGTLKPAPGAGTGNVTSHPLSNVGS